MSDASVTGDPTDLECGAFSIVHYLCAFGIDRFYWIDLCQGVSCCYLFAAPQVRPSGAPSSQPGRPISSDSRINKI